MALTGLAIAAALALAKDQMVDKPKEARQRKLAGETQRLSPWTKLQAAPIKEHDTMGTMVQYGATGAAMGSEYSKGKAPSSTDMYKMTATNPYSQPAVAPQGSGLYDNAPAWTNINSPWPYKGAPKDAMEYYDWRRPYEEATYKA